MLIFGLVWFLLWLFECRGLASIGMPREGALRNYGRGVLVGLAMFVGVILVMWSFGFTEIENPLRGASIAGAFFVLIGCRFGLDGNGI